MPGLYVSWEQREQNFELDCQPCYGSNYDRLDCKYCVRPFFSFRVFSFLFFFFFFFFILILFFFFFFFFFFPEEGLTVLLGNGSFMDSLKLWYQGAGARSPSIPSSRLKVAAVVSHTVVSISCY